MMQAMGLKSPAPIQSRLKHLQVRYISWQEGKARTMKIVDEIEGVPIISVAAGGLIETFLM